MEEETLFGLNGINGSWVGQAYRMSGLGRKGGGLFTYEKKRRPHNITTNLKNTNASDKVASYIAPSNRNVCPRCRQLVGEEYVGGGLKQTAPHKAGLLLRMLCLVAQHERVPANHIFSQVTTLRSCMTSLRKKKVLDRPSIRPYTEITSQEHTSPDAP